ncbi:zinc finger protein 596-like isoform X2 [Armigeres subalbatus]|uniref:zinc finger protein 596-like isoform X2 n=1 Tax=Armigeres subalbatus TaxID=124917 RepID=UPI002ED6AFB6
MSDLDIENICRLCCEKKNRMRSLFDLTVNDSTSLKQVILDVTRLEVEAEDGMPQKICRTCTSTLVKMRETIENYRANDVKLRQQLAVLHPLQIEIKEEEVDLETLENTIQQDIMTDNVTIKPEPEEDEYLDFEQLEEIEEHDPANEAQDVDESETETADEEIRHDGKVVDDDDGDWVQNDVAKDKAIKRKSSSKKSRKKKGSSDLQLQHPSCQRFKEHDLNRPRFQDFKCYICMSDSYGTVEAVMAHLNSSHLDILPYTCPECVMETVVIRTVVALNSHKRQHLNPEKCPLCDKRYSCKRGVELHMQMRHTGENEPNPSPCEMCGKVCSSKLTLKQHMRVHTSGSACEICGKIFEQRSKLRRHIQNRHEKIKKYECHICKKKLATLSAVQNHINTYHSSQVLTCSYCPKKFSSELTHRYHEKKHIENQNYVAAKEWKEYYTILEGEEGKKDKLKKCKLCDIVTRNMGTHLGRVHFPTEYRCEICGMTFKTKQSCDIHVLEHKHGKAHRCPICTREFSERKNLLTHLRTKKHQDHPLARAMLGTMKVTNSD